MAYTLTANYDNPPSLVVALTRDGGVFPTRSLYRFKVYSDSEGTQLVTGSGWITLSESTDTITYTFASVSPGTYYITAESDDPITFVSLQQTVLVDNTPRTATQSQWEDLTARIKAKSDVNITMTTTDPGEGSALSANNYVAVYGGDPIILDYSTTEINTGAKWIDGSAIYKKTINIGTVNTNSSAVIPHGISSFATFIKSEAWGSFGTPSTGYFWFSIPWSGSNHISLTVDEANVTVASTIGNNITSCYTTLYYTKSSS